ncbi:MAG: GreA/GreB family elongation factor, partial [Methyloceanibacter sp.]
LIDEDTDEKAKYRIVGELEANVKSGKISITSPLSRALLGKRKKDIVEVSTPGGGKSYKVVKVEFK